MIENRYWSSPRDRTVSGSLGLCHMSVFEPPFNVDARNYPPQDPVRSRAFAESLDTVEQVLDELGPRCVLTPLPSAVRADLDVVHVAAWGSMVGIADPVFAAASGGPLKAVAAQLRERYPAARIVGRVTYYSPAEDTEDTEDLVWLPDGAMFHAAGRSGVEPFAVIGDPDAVIASLGLAGWMLDNAGVDLAEKASEVEWARLAGLALGHSDPWGWEQMETTALRVRHSEAAVRSMEHRYFG
ncbi:DUF6333 family protein [Prauserella marina]|uniref:DUF6333 family protein n=1 Tax=Prauserella marina TaxID=530584 RepID=UPI001B86D3F6|nr:DUF6333 family protein [Prauserella marina]